MSRQKLIISGIALLSTILLANCSKSPSSGPESGSGSSLSSTTSASSIISASSASSAISSESEVELEAEAAAHTTYKTPHEALELVYENAVFVYDLTESVWDDLDPKERTVLEDVLFVFSDDIETLGYYLDVSEHEPLTDEEQELVLTIMVDIEEAMEILAQAIERLL